jgi:hypothetical protein
MRARGPQWGNRLEAEAQPPLSRNFWRNLGASPLPRKGAECPRPPPLKRWKPPERRKLLRRPPPP